MNCACGDEEALERQRRGEAVRWSLNARRDLTLRVSGDDGKTWSAGVLLEKEAGAADLAQSPEGRGRALPARAGLGRRQLHLHPRPDPHPGAFGPAALITR